MTYEENEKDHSEEWYAWCMLKIWKESVKNLKRYLIYKKRQNNNKKKNKNPNKNKRVKNWKFLHPN